MTEKGRALHMGMEGANIIAESQIIHESIAEAADPRKVLMYTSLRFVDRESAANSIDRFQVLPFMKGRGYRWSSGDTPLPGRQFLGYILNEGSQLMDLAEHEASLRASSQVGARDLIIASILDSRTDQPDQQGYWGANTDIVEQLRKEQTAQLYREVTVEGQFRIIDSLKRPLRRLRDVFPKQH